MSHPAWPPLAWLPLVCILTAPHVAAALGGACSANLAANSCPQTQPNLDVVLGIGHGSGYRPDQRPPCADGSYRGPTLVEVQFRLTQVNEVNEKLGHISVNGYLRTWWTDPRLAFNATAACSGSSVKLAGDALIQTTWRPDIYFDNLVMEKSLPGENSMAHISPSGDVWFSEQRVIIVRCDFDLRPLPFDSNRCFIRVASYSHDITMLRLMPKGGRVGAGASGIGITSPPVKHSLFTFDKDRTSGDAAKKGFSNPGVVEVVSDWDYVDLPFHLTRDPTHFERQVIIPCHLFLLASFLQLVVDRNASPARATLAILPVLIMVSLSAQVYRTLPEGAQETWLTDFIDCALALTTFASLEFGLVQLFCVQERHCRSKLEGLQKSRAVAERLIAQAAERGTTLLDLLKNCEPMEVLVKQVATPKVMLTARTQRTGSMSKAKTRMSIIDMETDNDELYRNAHRAFSSPRLPPLSQPPAFASVGEPEIAGEEESERRREKSDYARANSIQEADLHFIRHAGRIFARYCSGTTARVHTRGLRKALACFDIYVTAQQAAGIMCMFIRDGGTSTPIQEAEASLSFSWFTALLLQILDYHPQDHHSGRIMSWTARAYQTFWCAPPSQRVDLIARPAFLLAVALLDLLFFVIWFP